MSAEETAEQPKRKKMRGRNKMLLILFSLLMMALLRTGFVFFIIGMLPSIVIYYLDRSPHHYMFKTIFACNMSGMMPYLGKLLKHGPNSAALQEVMGDGLTWVVIYGSAAMGGLLISITPMIAQMMIGGLNQTQIARLRGAQKRIENEWGSEVKGFSGQE